LRSITELIDSRHLLKPPDIYEPLIAAGIHVFVAVIRLIPDRRIERVIGNDDA
jgi:hypothetical protein